MLQSMESQRVRHTLKKKEKESGWTRVGEVEGTGRVILDTSAVELT